PDGSACPEPGSHKSARRPIAYVLNGERSMKIVKRILAGLTLLVSVVMLLLSLAGGVGVWIVKGPVTDKATPTFERIEGALDVADQNTEPAKASLARATERLKKAREEQEELARKAQPNSALRRILARKALQTVAPDMGNAHDKLHTVAEAAVVINAVLE